MISSDMKTSFAPAAVVMASAMPAAPRWRGPKAALALRVVQVHLET